MGRESRETYHRLREGGMDDPAADGVVEVLSPFVTREILQAELAKVQLRIVTFVAVLNVGIATIAVTVATQVT